MNTLNKGYIPACFLSLMLMTTAAAEAAKADNDLAVGQLRVAAVLDGKPVFKSATWRIRCQNKSRRYGATVNRHAAVLDLEPGSCTVKVTMDGKSRTRYIKIEKDKQHSLVVSFG